MGACCAPSAPAAAKKNIKNVGPKSAMSAGSKQPYIAKMKVRISNLIKESKSFSPIRQLFSFRVPQASTLSLSLFQKHSSRILSSTKWLRSSTWCSSSRARYSFLWPWPRASSCPT